MSYNEECSICIEKFDNQNSITLSCNHTFHSECIMKYIETEFNNYRKQHQNERICCKQFKCPLCRKSISCKDSNPLIYNYYQKYKQQYKQINKQINKLQKESYLFTFKFQVKKLFRKINQQEAYKFLIEDETLLETIMLHKEKYNEIKELMYVYKQIYYDRCTYCTYTRSSLYFSDI